MKNFRKFVVAVLMIGSSQFVMAQGLYALGTLGITIPASSVKSDLDKVMTAVGVRGLSSSMSNGTSMGGGLGYALSESFSVEGSYLNTGKMTYSATGTGVKVSAGTTVTAMQVALLGITPVNDKVSLFGKLGYSWTTAKTSGTVNSTAIPSTSTESSSAGYGVGALYKLTDQLSLRASYEVFASDASGVLIGLQIKF